MIYSPQAPGQPQPFHIGVPTCIYHLHLSPGAKMAHRASKYAFHRFLSCAAVRTSLQDCHPVLDLSFSTVLRQVVFGRPLFLFPSGVYARAVTQSLSGCCLRICPQSSRDIRCPVTLQLNFKSPPKFQQNKAPNWKICHVLVFMNLM